MATVGRRISVGEPAWRSWLRSWWVLLAPLGWLNWTAFLYAGLRVRNRRWIVYAVVYLAASAASLALIVSEPGAEAGTQGQIGAWLGILSWGFSLVHALVIRRDFLERLEAREDPRLDAAEDRLLRREFALSLVADDPQRARDLGIGRPDLPNAYDSGLVDVNHAPADVLGSLPGVSESLAKRIVAVREEIGGFDSLDDLGHVLDLPAPAVDRLRGLAVFLPG